MDEGHLINAQINYRGWRFLMCVILFLALGAHLFADITRSPDFAPYVDITENLMSLSFVDLVPFESLSRGMLMLSAWLFDDAYKGVVFVHWVNSVTFVCGFIWVTRLNRDNWQGALLAFTAYGALLCFVTLRATPAYLIATYAVLNQRMRPHSYISLMILAACFHISALLVIPAIIFNNISLRMSSKWHRTLYLYIYFVGIVSYVAITLGFNFGDRLGKIFGDYDNLIKFVVYAEEPQVASIAHRIYFVLLALLVAMFLMNNSEKIQKQKIFVCTLFVIIALSSISPVVAFRQSIYLTMPIFLLFPWRKWVNSDIKAIIFWIICIIFSILSFLNIF